MTLARTEMTQSTRKLVGTLLMIVLLITYPLLGMTIYVNYLPEAPWWLAIGYALVVGLLWALPAMAIIRWMARPS